MTVTHDRCPFNYTYPSEYNQVVVYTNDVYCQSCCHYNGTRVIQCVEYVDCKLENAKDVLGEILE
jgi:hypothetical protein